MKHLTLTLTLIALAGVPVVVYAKDNPQMKQDAQAQQNAQSALIDQKVETRKDGDRTYTTRTETYEYLTGETVIGEFKPKPGQYQLNNGQILQVGPDRKQAQFVTASGGTYFAPSGEYLTVSKNKFFIEDGEITGFLPEPAEPSFIADVDVDADNDGAYMEADEDNVVIR